MFRTKTTPETVADKVKAAVADAGSVASERLAEAKDRLADSSAVETARERVAEAAETVKAYAADTAESVKAKAADAADTARSSYPDAADAARYRAAAAADTAKVRAAEVGDKARSTWLDVVMPYAGTIISAAAGVLKQARSQADDAAARAVDAAAPRVEAAREVYGEGAHRASDALAILKGEAVAKPKSRGNGGKAALILVGLAAAGAAAYVVFRDKKQADDPWAAPLTDPVIAPDVDVNTSGQSLKDKAAGAVETAKEKASDLADSAKEKASDLADSAKEKASDLAAKGQAAVADAKDHTGELGSEINNGNDSSNDSDTHLDGDVVDGIEAMGHDSAGSAGEVTAVDGTIGADGVVGDMPTGEGDLSPAELADEKDYEEFAEEADRKWRDHN